MKKSRFHALIASATAFCMAFTQVAVAAPAFSTPAPEVSLPDIVRLDQAIQISVPGSLATVDKWIAGNDKTIFHIQSAHGQYQAEKQIEKLLGHLETNYGVDTVLLEGASQPLNPEVINFFPDNRPATLEAVDAFVRHAVISGPEVFLLNSSKARGFGIEDQVSYEKNLQDFAAVIQAREASDQFLAELDQGIERLAAIYLSSDLRSFLKRVERKETGDVPFDIYLQQLKLAAEQHLGVDFSDAAWQLLWPMLTRVFAIEKLEAKIDGAVFQKQKDAFLKAVKPFLQKTLYEEVEKLLILKDLNAKLPDPETSVLFEALVRSLPDNFRYDHYSSVTAFCGLLMLKSQIRIEDLSGEMTRAEDKIAEWLAETKTARELVSILKDYRMLKKLFALELLPADFDALSQQPVRPAQLVDRLKKLNGDARAKEVNIQSSDELNALYDKAVEFYEGARFRDQKMLARVEERLTETGADKVAVITGGFHSEPFASYFENRGYSYALMTPQLKTVDVNGRQNYLDVMQMWASAPSVSDTLTSGTFVSVSNATIQPNLVTADPRGPSLLDRLAAQILPENVFAQYMEWRSAKRDRSVASTTDLRTAEVMEAEVVVEVEETVASVPAVSGVTRRTFAFQQLPVTALFARTSFIAFIAGIVAVMDSFGSNFAVPSEKMIEFDEQLKALGKKGQMKTDALDYLLKEPTEQGYAIRAYQQLIRIINAKDENLQDRLKAVRILYSVISNHPMRAMAGAAVWRDLKFSLKNSGGAPIGGYLWALYGVLIDPNMQAEFSSQREAREVKEEMAAYVERRVKEAAALVILPNRNNKTDEIARNFEAVKALVTVEGVPEVSEVRAGLTPDELNVIVEAVGKFLSPLEPQMNDYTTGLATQILTAVGSEKAADYLKAFIATSATSKALIREMSRRVSEAQKAIETIERERGVSRSEAREREQLNRRGFLLTSLMFVAAGFISPADLFAQSTVAPFPAGNLVSNIQAQLKTRTPDFIDPALPDLTERQKENITNRNKVIETKLLKLEEIRNADWGPRLFQDVARVAGDRSEDISVRVAAFKTLQHFYENYPMPDSDQVAGYVFARTSQEIESNIPGELQGLKDARIAFLGVFVTKAATYRQRAQTILNDDVAKKAAAAAEATKIRVAQIDEQLKVIAAVTEESNYTFIERAIRALASFSSELTEQERSKILTTLQSVLNSSQYKREDIRIMFLKSFLNFPGEDSIKIVAEFQQKNNQNLTLRSESDNVLRVLKSRVPSEARSEMRRVSEAQIKNAVHRVLKAEANVQSGKTAYPFLNLLKRTIQVLSFTVASVPFIYLSILFVTSLSWGLPFYSGFLGLVGALMQYVLKVFLVVMVEAFIVGISMIPFGITATIGNLFSNLLFKLTVGFHQGFLGNFFERDFKNDILSGISQISDADLFSGLIRSNAGRQLAMKMFVLPRLNTMGYQNPTLLADAYEGSDYGGWTVYSPGSLSYDTLPLNFSTREREKFDRFMLEAERLVHERLANEIEFQGLMDILSQAASQIKRGSVAGQAAVTFTVTETRGGFETGFYTEDREDSTTVDIYELSYEGATDFLRTKLQSRSEARATDFKSMRQEMQPIIDLLGLGETDVEYFLSMLYQHRVAASGQTADSKKLRETFWPSALLTTEQVKAKMGEVQYSEMLEVVNALEGTAIVDVRFNSMDGGLGTSVDRFRDNLLAVIEDLNLDSKFSFTVNLAQGDAARATVEVKGTPREMMLGIVAAIDENNKKEKDNNKAQFNRDARIDLSFQGTTETKETFVQIGAKGTDLPFDIVVNGKKMRVTVAEMKAHRMYINRDGYASASFRPMVNEDSAPSYEEFLDAPYFMDVANGVEKPRTYRELLNEGNLSTAEPEQFHMQAKLPNLRVVEGVQDYSGEVAGDLTVERTAPGNHGQLGFSLVVEDILNKAEEILLKSGKKYDQTAGKWVVDETKEQRTVLEVFQNGDNASSTINPEVAQYIAALQIALLIVSTDKTPVDMKGGQIGLQAKLGPDGKPIGITVNADGTITIAEGAPVKVTIMEKAEAEADKDLGIFYPMGIDGKFGLPGRKQSFNTNAIVFNATELAEILIGLQDVLGREELLKRLAPDNISETKKKVDQPFHQLGGAISSLVFNLNAIFTLADPATEEGRKIRAIRDGSILTLLNLSAEERSMFFAPIKTSSDYALLNYMDFYEYSPEGRLRIKDEHRNSLLPQFSFSGAAEGFFKDTLNAKDALTGVTPVNLDLTIDGDGVLVPGAKLSGKIIIENKSGRVINLNEILNDSYFKDGRLNLENIKVIIAENGLITTVSLLSLQESQAVLGQIQARGSASRIEPKKEGRLDFGRTELWNINPQFTSDFVIAPSAEKGGDVSFKFTYAPDVADPRTYEVKPADPIQYSFLIDEETFNIIAPGVLVRSEMREFYLKYEMGPSDERTTVYQVKDSYSALRDLLRELDPRATIDAYNDARITVNANTGAVALTLSNPKITTHYVLSEDASWLKASTWVQVVPSPNFSAELLKTPRQAERHLDPDQLVLRLVPARSEVRLDMRAVAGAAPELADLPGLSEVYRITVESEGLEALLNQNMPRENQLPLAYAQMLGRGKSVEVYYSKDGEVLWIQQPQIGQGVQFAFLPQDVVRTLNPKRNLVPTIFTGPVLQGVFDPERSVLGVNVIPGGVGPDGRVYRGWGVYPPQYQNEPIDQPGFTVTPERVDRDSKGFRSFDYSMTKPFTVVDPEDELPEVAWLNTEAGALWNFVRAQFPQGLSDSLQNRLNGFTAFNPTDEQPRFIPQQLRLVVNSNEELVGIVVVARDGAIQPLIRFASQTPLDLFRTKDVVDASEFNFSLRNNALVVTQPASRSEVRFEIGKEFILSEDTSRGWTRVRYDDNYAHRSLNQGAGQDARNLTVSLKTEGTTRLLTGSFEVSLATGLEGQSGRSIAKIVWDQGTDVLNVNGDSYQFPDGVRPQIFFEPEANSLEISFGENLPAALDGAVFRGSGALNAVQVSFIRSGLLVAADTVGPQSDLASQQAGIGEREEADARSEARVTVSDQDLGQTIASVLLRALPDRYQETSFVESGAFQDADRFQVTFETERGNFSFLISENESFEAIEARVQALADDAQSGPSFRQLHGFGVDGRVLINQAITAVVIEPYFGNRQPSAFPGVATTTVRSESRLTLENAIVLLEKFTFGIITDRREVETALAQGEESVLLRAAETVLKRQIVVSQDEEAGSYLDQILDLADKAEIGFGVGMAAFDQGPVATATQGSAKPILLAADGFLHLVESNPRAALALVQRFSDEIASGSKDARIVLALGDGDKAEFFDRVSAKLSSRDSGFTGTLADIKGLITQVLDLRNADELADFTSRANGQFAKIDVGIGNELFGTIQGGYQFELKNGSQALSGKDLWAVAVVGALLPKAIATVENLEADVAAEKLLEFFNNQQNVIGLEHQGGVFKFGAIKTLLQAIVAAQYIEIMA